MKTKATTQISRVVFVHSLLLAFFRPGPLPQPPERYLQCLVPTGSDFAGQAVVQTGTVTISDREGIIIVSRSFVYEGAYRDVLFNKDIREADNNATIHSGKTPQEQDSVGSRRPEGDYDYLWSDDRRELHTSHIPRDDGARLFARRVAADYPGLPAQIDWSGRKLWFARSGPGNRCSRGGYR